MSLFKNSVTNLLTGLIMYSPENYCTMGNSLRTVINALRKQCDPISGRIRLVRLPDKLGKTRQARQFHNIWHA